MLKENAYGRLICNSHQKEGEKEAQPTKLAPHTRLYPTGLLILWEAQQLSHGGPLGRGPRGWPKWNLLGNSLH